MGLQTEHSAHKYLTFKENNMNNQMGKLDVFKRALVGFDTIFANLEQRHTDVASTNYPPHNLLKITENEYELQVAVTGFEKSEIQVEVNNNVLTIKGEREQLTEPDYIHKGLSTRDFTRVFPLAEYLEVRSAVIKNGLLIINIVRNVPEAKKPRIIDIVEVK